MKKNAIKLFVISLSTLSILSSCNSGGKVDPVDPPEPTPTPVVDYEALAKAYEEDIASHKLSLASYPSVLKVFNLLSSFETNLIRSKDSSYALDNIIAFREEVYNGDTWSLIASNKSTSVTNLFNQYKNTSYAKTNWINSGENYLDTFNIPVDFYHMLAVYNTYIYNSTSARDLASFGGDISQLVTELKNMSGTEQELLAYAETGGGLFSDPDLYADIDGANIYNTYATSKFYTKVRGSSLALSYYYINLNSNKDRMDRFVSSTFPTFTVDAIYNRLSSNFYLIAWNAKNGISFSEHKTLFKIAIQGFINRINKIREA